VTLPREVTFAVMASALPVRVAEVRSSCGQVQILYTNYSIQLLFGAVVLALSAVLIAQYGPGGHGPSLFDYGAFCGGASVVIALIGIAASFYDGLQGMVMLVLDGLSSFFLLAGGIVSCGHLLSLRQC
jgi:hypothetical protein